MPSSCSRSSLGIHYRFRSGHEHALEVNVLIIPHYHAAGVGALLVEPKQMVQLGEKPRKPVLRRGGGSTSGFALRLCSACSM